MLSKVSNNHHVVDVSEVRVQKKPRNACVMLPNLSSCISRQELNHYGKLAEITKRVSQGYSAMRSPLDEDALK